MKTTQQIIDKINNRIESLEKLVRESTGDLHKNWRSKLLALAELREWIFMDEPETTNMNPAEKTNVKEILDLIQKECDSFRFVIDDPIFSTQYQKDCETRWYCLKNLIIRINETLAKKDSSQRVD